VIEPDHSDGYDDSRYDEPAQAGPSWDTPPGEWRSYDPPSYDSPSYSSASHDDIGIYRRRSDDRAGDRSGARRDSGDFPPAHSRDSGDFPPMRSAEPAAHEERDDRDDRWVREPSRRSSGPRPQLGFEVNDDRWH
jgi:hypothetical protein